MKILLAWIVFTCLLSIAIVVKAPEFLPTGESSAKLLEQSSQLSLLDELIQNDTIELEGLQKKRLVIQSSYKANVINEQLDTLPITSLLFALLGLNIINILFISVFWLVTKKSKSI